MRVNVYAEEIRNDKGPDIVTTSVKDEPGIVYHGLRLWTGPDIVHRPGDDDSSAITFWITRKEDGRPDIAELRTLLYSAIDHLNELQRVTHAQPRKDS